MESYRHVCESGWLLFIMVAALIDLGYSLGSETEF